jgi:hypothetical protein
MLPPVPGPPIYLFGGLVISKHCPYGFWCLDGIGDGDGPWFLKTPFFDGKKT